MSDRVALLRQVMPAILPRLRRFARALAHNQPDADVLAQRTIERALARAAPWQAPPEGTSAAQLEAAIRSWLFGLMKVAWLDEQRATRRKRGAFAAAEVASGPASTPTTAQPRLSIQAALGRLPEEQHLAVVLVLVEGLTYGEAAEIIGIPAGKLTSRLSRGREALASMLQESGRTQMSPPGSAWDDVQVQAFVDGELDLETATRLAAQVRLDLTLAERVARARALRARLAGAFNPVLQEPIPARLLETMAGSAATPTNDARRAPGERAPGAGARPGALWWSIAAASIVMALLIGRQMPRPIEGTLVPGDFGLRAGGALAEALSQRLSAEGSKERGMLISLSFKAGDGRYCRTFSLHTGIDGLACRGTNNWQIEAMGRSPAPDAPVDNTHRQASTELSPAVMAAISRWQAGNSLTREEERRIRDNGWR